MSRKILHKRGLKANLPRLDEAEFALTTDDKKVHIGTKDGNMVLMDQNDKQDISRQLADKAQKSDLLQEKTRIDNLVANAGDTDGNAELLDIRVGFDGVTYPTAGDAVRSIGTFLTDVNEIWEVN